MTAGLSWDDLVPPGLPVHDDEVLASHGCQPSEEAAVKNGSTPAPGRDGSQDGGTVAYGR